MAHDLCIVGAGPVGMALAVALRDRGLDIVLVDARDRGAARSDPRTLALSHGSYLTLKRLGVWDALPVTPIRSIHVSQRGGFGRTRIEAEEHGLPALGYVVAAGALASALDDAVSACGFRVIERSKVAKLAPGADHVAVHLQDGIADGLGARLVACAEGSMDGDDAQVKSRDYGQHAVITTATPDEDHTGLAYERFTEHGPLALLPCGARYAVVHTASPAGAEALLGLDEATYLSQLSEHMAGRVRFTATEPRLRFPLMLRYRRQPVGERTVWLGNAAQTLHPVAGQGFNLALRDVWALARRLNAVGAGDPGSPALIADYGRARRADRGATIGATDSLVRLFSNDVPALRRLRGGGLLLLDVFPPLRGFLARRMMFGARAWP